MTAASERLAVSLINDMPRAFTHLNGNRTLYGGPYAQAIKYFAHYKNFDLDFVVFDDWPSLMDIYFDIYHGRFNISTYSTAFVKIKLQHDQSYPVEYMEKCVMVPLAPEIPKSLYIILPYGPYIWMLIFVGAVYIGVLMRFMAPGSGTQSATRSIIRNVPHALNISLYTNNMGLNIKNAPIKVMFFYFLLYIYGFILAAYHAPYMTAYNMKPLFLPPLDTLQDILDAKLRLKVKSSDYLELHSNDDIDLTSIEHIMDNVTGVEFQRLLRNFNRSFAYVVSLDQWEFIRKQQESLKQPYFHLSKVCLSASLRVFPIQPNWTYATALEIFLLRSQQSGLWRQWIERAFTTALFSKNAIILLDTYPVEPLNIQFFIIAWSVLIVGCTLSSIAFIIEYSIWFNQSRKLNVIVV